MQSGHIGLEDIFTEEVVRESPLGFAMDLEVFLWYVTSICTSHS